MGGRNDTGDGDASLADGVLVETRIVARLLRMPILRLDGVVVLSPVRSGPVDVGTSVVVRPDVGGGPIGADLPRVADTIARLRPGGTDGSAP